MSGFILLHRQIQDWQWFQDANTFRVFILLLLKANWEPKRWKNIEIQRGQLVSSIGHIAKDLQISDMQTRTALNKLKSSGEITIKVTNKYSLYTIINYNDFQQNDKEITNNLTGKQQANNKQITTTKEYNNIINNNIISDNTTTKGEKTKNADELEIILPAHLELARESVREWLAYKKEKKKSYKKTGFKQFLKKLERDFATADALKAGIENSMANNYEGVYPASGNRMTSRRQAGEDALERSKARTRAMRAEVEREKAERAKSGVIEVPSHVQTRPAELEYFDFWGEINDKKGE